MVISLRIDAVKATLAGFPFSTNRLWNEAIELLPRTADKVAIYRTERTSARPPQIMRYPRWKPLSRLNGAKPAKAAISRRFNRPNSGKYDSNVNIVTGPTPGALCSKSTRSFQMSEAFKVAFKSSSRSEMRSFS